MNKRRPQDSDYLFGSEDDPIGLTSAFAPVKGPQSVEYDEGDSAIGLTQAFEPIPEQEEPRAWDEAGKWKDFDWSAPYGEGDDEGGYEGEYEGEDVEPEVQSIADEAQASQADAAAAAQASTTAAVSIGGHAAKTSKAASSSSGGTKRGRHAAPDASESPRMQQSRKTRRKLIVVIVLLIIVLVGLGIFMARTFSQSQEEAAHQAQEQVESPKEDIGKTPADDAGDAQVKLTEVPKVVSVLGMNSDKAIEEIGHGALITANRPVDEEGNPVKTNLNVALTQEPTDSKTGSPTVYLGLDKDGNVIQVGYSASASALGFGSLSFSDAVNNEHVIEKTMAKIGVELPDGTVKLPENKDEYSTYAEDGTTVTRERCSFEGDADVNGTPCSWSSVLSYDYTTQVVTGNLSDTVRIIYVYVTQK